MSAITAACLLGANKLEASFDRSIVCGRQFTPTTRRAAIDVPSYEVDNMSLVRSISMLSTAEPQHVVHQPYHRCENDQLNSDIVGVRSSVFVALPPGSSECNVMTKLAADLEASGWSVHRQESSAMTAERKSEQLDLRIDSRDTYLGVVADHDAPNPSIWQSNVANSATFDCQNDG